MDEISLKGENYVKASILGRKFGYTSDYVGQLCRSGQVTATLIGRSWYVTEESLLRHKKGRYRSSLAKSKEMVRKYAEERRQIPSRVTNVKRIVRYEEDPGDLLPNLRVREPVTDIAEVPAYEENYVPAVEESDEIRVNIQHKPEVQPISMAQMAPRPSFATSQRHRRPPVRTIPAFSVPEIVTKRPSEQPILENIRPPRPTSRPSTAASRRSLVPALILTILLGEVLLMTAIIGTEKQMTVRSDGSGMIVYDFEPDMVAASIKALME